MKTTRCGCEAQRHFEVPDKYFKTCFVKNPVSLIPSESIQISNVAKNMILVFHEAFYETLFRVSVYIRLICFVKNTYFNIYYSFDSNLD